MFEFRAMVSHLGGKISSENENQLNNLLRSKNVQPSMHKNESKKMAFGDLKNTLSETPSRNLQKPKSQVPPLKFATKAFTANKSKPKSQPKFESNWEPKVLQADDLGQSQTKIWMPNDEEINRILFPKIIMEPVSPIKRDKPVTLSVCPDFLQIPEVESELPPPWDIELPELDIYDVGDISLLELSSRPAEGGCAYF